MHCVPFSALVTLITIPIQVIEEVGADRFQLVCSDDTGNTRLARTLITTKFPWIWNSPDPCHRLSNTVKDIVTQVPVFKAVRYPPLSIISD